MLSLNLSTASASSSTLPFLPKPLFAKSSFNGIQLRPRSTCSVPLSCSGTRTAAASVVMMAKREEEMKEIRQKTTDQINEEVVELKGELLMLRLQQSARNEFKSSEFRRMRKRAFDERAQLGTQYDEQLTQSRVCDLWPVFGNSGTALLCC
ncbi:large ribosomal subunit protein uL29c isoform X2 [Arachis hypogaea]|uniref:large ribosomal subunit protein uL29c isoform X2 n=1 Tax=Arachis hypogaea TaxID=3818 RepID=UPI000DECCF94|nr:50S ribosomal protein L29, chloroplastic isoform X2 [Arachis hypogaea]